MAQEDTETECGEVDIYQKSYKHHRQTDRRTTACRNSKDNSGLFRDSKTTWQERDFLVTPFLRMGQDSEQEPVTRLTSSQEEGRESGKEQVIPFLGEISSCEKVS